MRPYHLCQQIRWHVRYSNRCVEHYREQDCQCMHAFTNDHWIFPSLMSWISELHCSGTWNRSRTNQHIAQNVITHLDKRSTYIDDCCMHVGSVIYSPTYIERQHTYWFRKESADRGNFSTDADFVVQRQRLHNLRSMYFPFGGVKYLDGSVLQDASGNHGMWYDPQMLSNIFLGYLCGLLETTSVNTGNGMSFCCHPIGSKPYVKNMVLVPFYCHLKRS